MKKLLLSTAATFLIAAAAVCSGSVLADLGGGFGPPGGFGPRGGFGPPTATPIKHVVVIFNENRSFDHYFATYPTATNPPGDGTVFKRGPQHAGGKQSGRESVSAQQ